MFWESEYLRIGLSPKRCRSPTGCQSDPGYCKPSKHRTCTVFPLDIWWVKDKSKTSFESLDRPGNPPPHVASPQPGDGGKQPCAGPPFHLKPGIEWLMVISFRQKSISYQDYVSHIMCPNCMHTDLVCSRFIQGHFISERTKVTWYCGSPPLLIHRLPPEAKGSHFTEQLSVWG